MLKGDIVDINLGNPPDEVKGHEQGLVRPCVVIKAFDSLGLCVIVPCTRTKPRYALYTSVELAAGEGGLDSDSYALCHQIRTVSYNRIGRVRGQLRTTDILRITGVLLDTLEL